MQMAPDETAIIFQSCRSRACSPRYRSPKKNRRGKVAVRELEYGEAKKIGILKKMGMLCSSPSGCSFTRPHVPLIISLTSGKKHGCEAPDD